MIDEEVELLVSKHRKWQDVEIPIFQTNEKLFSSYSLDELPGQILVYQDKSRPAAFMLRTVLPKLHQDTHVLDWWSTAPNNAVLISIRPFGIEDL